MSVGDVMMLLSAVTLSVENRCTNVFPPRIKYFITFFFRLIKTQKNVNMRNELNFSDIYRSINYIGSLPKFT